MILLAVDTSGAAVTVAVHRLGHVLAEASVHEPRRHAELVAPLVEEVLSASGVDRRRLTGVAVGVGPGPFTGLRVGVVTGLVLGAALGIGVHGLCSLDAIAAATPAPQDGDGDLVVATDARRREVYWARYRRVGARPERVEGPHVGPAEEVPVQGAQVTGRACLLYPEVLGQSQGPLDVDAGVLAHVVAARLAAGGAGLLPPEPLYLRRPDAQEPGARKRVLR